MGGGVANLVAASLISSEAIPEISELDGNSDNVYCYTFAAPNTFYLTDNKYERDNRGIEGKKITGNYREPHGVKYRCIFNIVNDDDFVPKLPMEKCEWTKYGRVATLSVLNEFRSNYAKLGIIFLFNSNDKIVIKNYNLLNFLLNYNGNPIIPNDIASAFSNLFENKSKMRKDSYNFRTKYNITIYMYDDENLDKKLIESAIPFQKNKYLTTNYLDYDIKQIVYLQEMCPQYLFSLLGGAMHESNNENNKIKFFNTRLPRDLAIAKSSIISIIPLNLNVVHLEDPHYLESYYTLTKLIEIKGFK